MVAMADNVHCTLHCFSAILTSVFYIISRRNKTTFVSLGHATCTPGLGLGNLIIALSKLNQLAKFSPLQTD